jgi:hypothetical protein
MYTKNDRDFLGRSELIDYWFNVTRKSDQLASFQSRIETQLKEKFFDSSVELVRLHAVTAERDAVTAERDAVTAERDAVTAERDRIVSSNSWRITKPLRMMESIFRNSKKQTLNAGELEESKRETNR